MTSADLRGARLRLRRVALVDDNAVSERVADRAFVRRAGEVPEWSAYSALRDIWRCVCERGDTIRFAVERLEDERIVGMLDLRVLSRFRCLGEIGYALVEDVRGRGYSVEAVHLLVGFAFRELGLRRIQAICATRNQRSYRTMERLGMIREQIIFGAAKSPRHAGDQFVYSLGRRAWLRRGCETGGSPGARSTPVA